ncbi:MAG: hypothetical protein VX700_12300 [Pseudomonadota bacterium]|nr:hypothetical protein [Pseudomonadota bacterium]
MAGIWSVLKYLQPDKGYGKLSFAHPYCPLETIADATGGMAAKELIARSHAIASIAKAVSRLIEDEEEGMRALAKALHILIEDRMRLMAVTVDSPTKLGYGTIRPDPGPYPLDRYCAETLDRAAPEFGVIRGLCATGWQLDPSFNARLKIRIKILAAAALVSARSFFIPLRRGVRKVTPIETGALLENFVAPELLEALADASSAAGYNDPDQYTVLVERDNALPSHGFRFIQPGKLRVPVASWCAKVMIPTWRFSIQMAGHAITGNKETCCAAFEALRIAAAALTVWPKAYNFRSRTVADNTEYLPVSAIKGALFRKFGAKFVRWPGTEIDTFGSLLANSAHDHFISGGHYQSATFSTDWRAPEHGRTIGVIQADKRLANPQLVDPDLRRRLEELHRDRKMLVYFGSGTETNMAPFIASVFRAVMEVFQQSDGWFLVIKSKRYTTFMDLIRSMSDFPKWVSDERIVIIDYPPEPTDEICPTGWLAAQMDLGTGYFGSTLAECTGRGYPYCTHLPVIYDTPFMNKLTQHGVVVRDPDGFKSRLASALAGDVPCIPQDWGSWAFDPYQDDRPLERLAALLMDKAQPIR